MHRVVITGMGVISPVGQSVGDCFASLIAARSGVRAVDANTYTGSSPLAVGAVDFHAANHLGASAAHLDRATQFALAATAQAVADSSLALSDDEMDRAGVYWGTGLGGAISIEDSYRQIFSGSGRVRPTAVVMGMSNAAAGHISIAHGLRGPALNVSTACSSSAVSIGEALRAIAAGHADVIIAGGSEALLTDGNLRAWDAMQALAHVDAGDPARTCRPFAADRRGIVLGEGAAALVLERADRALARGARVYAELAGYGNAADARAISRPDAAGQARAIRAALAAADLDPRDIGYVNAHGTATLIGDVVETSALKEVFGDEARDVAISSTKALHGHLMGAAGALEMVVAIMALVHGIVPPTAHLCHKDADCDLDYVPLTARTVSLRAVMSNSFGFGGMNAALIARRYQE